MIEQKQWSCQKLLVTDQQELLADHTFYSIISKQYKHATSPL
jgi:hypothetical protein